MIQVLNDNSGLVTGMATVALLIVTAAYVWITYKLLIETKQARLSADRPRVVAYLRVHEVHSTLVQLHVANLSGAAALGVSASVERLTAWPERFDLDDSSVLRNLSFLRAHEVLKFDLSLGPDLFRDGDPARFEVRIRFGAADGRTFDFVETLSARSVDGFGEWKVYGIDDVARRLQDISETLRGFSGRGRIRVETYDSDDRREESEARERARVARRREG